MKGEVCSPSHVGTGERVILVTQRNHGGVFTNFQTTVVAVTYQRFASAICLGLGLLGVAARIFHLWLADCYNPQE